MPRRELGALGKHEPFSELDGLRLGVVASRKANFHVAEQLRADISAKSKSHLFNIGSANFEKDGFLWIHEI